MVDSQNGYSVIERDEAKSYDVGVEGLTVPLRNDDAGFVLANFLRRFDNRVEKLGRTETFGYSKRQIAGSDEWSNHASGTAADANASQHPFGKVGTFTVNEVFEIRELLREYDGVIRWGGDYNGTKDEMHFEIDREYDEVKLIASIIKRKNRVYLSRLQPGNRNLDVYMVKRELKRRGFYDKPVNRYFGKSFTDAYRKWQQSLGYTGSDADGTPGRASLEALDFRVKEG